MSVLVWRRTKYWVSRTLVAIIADIPLFKTQRAVFMKPIRAWLARYATCETYVQWMTLQTDDQLRSHFYTYMHSQISNDPAPWRRMWGELWHRCLQPIVRVLMPLELAATQSEIATSKEKGRAYRRKTMDAAICAAYRCGFTPFKSSRRPRRGRAGFKRKAYHAEVVSFNSTGWICPGPHSSG